MFSAFRMGPTASGLSYSPVPLAVGPILNAEKMESLLAIGGTALF